MAKKIYTKKLGKLVANDAKGPPNGSSVHVISSNSNKWSVVNNGNIHVLRSFYRKESAVNYAKKKAGEVIVHKSDGTIGQTYTVKKH